MDSPEHLTPDSFRFFAATVSAQSNLDERRTFVKEHQSNINESILETFERGTGTDAFALLDAAKSVVTRGELLRRRFGPSDVMFHGTLGHHIGDMLRLQPDVVFVNLFQSPSHDFRAVLAYIQDGEIRVEKVEIATGNAGDVVYRTTMDYAAMLAGKTPKGGGVDLLPALAPFAAEIIPRIRRMGGERRVVLIPHKALHALPLHLMTAELDGEMLFLDQVSRATIYSSSLFALYFGNMSIKKGDTSAQKSLLACVDVNGLGEWAGHEAEAYWETLQHSMKVDIVTQPESFPKDLSCYPLLMWSSHGVSHASDWRLSRLIFGTHDYTAIEIMEHWNLESTSIGVLSACETGIDLATDDVIDEYCGLDMALHIAGSRTVVSTMWKVQDVVAQFVNSILFETILMGKKASTVLPSLRFLMMSGKWRGVLEKSYVEMLRSPHGREARMKIVERLLSVPDDLFRQISAWGVYRCFGNW